MVRKKEDSYTGIVNLFNPKPQMDTLPFIETGEIISPLPNLVIKVRELEMKKEKIKLDEYWVKGHKREIEIPSAPFTGSDSKGDSHIAGGYPKAYVIFKDELKAGDLVACLLSRDKQTLYVLFKIARW